jgi:protocatechuate 3,4-dioxygenase beta subunit
MWFRFGRVVALMGIAAAGGSIAGVAQTPSAPTPPPTGLIVGRVVDAAGGSPVSGAVVMIVGGTPAAVTTLPTGEIITNPAQPGAGMPPGSSAPRQVLTDSDGRFLFRELGKGRHTIRVTAAGYVAGAYGQNRPAGTAQPVELAHDDEKIGGLVVRMWKGAAMSGTVTDEAGEPVVGQMIRVMRRTSVGGRTRWTISLTPTTDDRGVFRAANLMPGDYYVGIVSSISTVPASTADAYLQLMAAGGSTINSDLYRELMNSGAPMPNMGGFRFGDFILQAGTMGRGGSTLLPGPSEDGRMLSYATAFYPGATTPAQATIVTLGSGEERRGIDLQLRLVSTVRVSGSVTGPDGPMRNTGITLVPQGSEEFSGVGPMDMIAATTATNAAGEFTFLGVTSGQYILRVQRVPRPLVSASSSMPMTTIEVVGPGGMMMGMSSSSGPPTAPPPPLPTEPTLWATQAVAVGDRDVGGLKMHLQPGGRVSGVLKFEGAATPPAGLQLQRTSISIASLEPRPGALLSTQVRVEADGRFNTVGFVPGRYTVSASIPPATPGPGAIPSSWTLKSATLGGRAVSDDGLEIGAEDISGLVITFTDQTTELTGSVTDGKGQPDRNAEIVVFPADSMGWKQGIVNARRLRTMRSSTTGQFTLSGLPPGEYFIVAVNSEAAGEWQDPKFLESLTRVATRVALTDGEKKTQSLISRVVRQP